MKTYRKNIHQTPGFPGQCSNKRRGSLLEDLGY